MSVHFFFAESIFANAYYLLNLVDKNISNEGPTGNQSSKYWLDERSLNARNFCRYKNEKMLAKIFLRKSLLAGD